MRVAEAKNVRDLVGACETLRQERLANRMPFEEIWWNNLAMIAGDHYMHWDSTMGNYVEWEREEHEVRLVLNHTRVVARTELAKLTKARPVMEVMAKSDDTEDIAATKVAKFALDACEQRYSLRRFRKSAYVWMIATGSGGMYVGYDPNDDKDGNITYIIDPATGEAVWHPERKKELMRMVDEGELEDLAEEEYPMGDIDFAVYSPFQMLPDDTALQWEDVDDIIVTDVVQIDKAEATWGLKLKAEDKTPGVIETRVIRRLGQSLAEMFGGTSKKDTVQVHTYWLKPGVYTHNQFLANGCMIRWANGHTKVEDNFPFPFDDGELPFVFFTHIDNPTALWGDAVISDVRAPNIELDRTVSQLLENRDYMSNPMWSVAEQVQLRGDAIKSQPGGMVRYTHIKDIPEPHPIQGEQLPVQVENLAVALRDQILDLSGQGEVSRGRVPSGVRAGNMMAYLQEEDETKLAPTAENIEDGIARMSTLVLSRLSQFWSHERLLRYYKPGGSADIRKFKGADLKGHTDVVPQVGSGLSKSKAVKQQNAMTMAELMPGSLTPKALKDIMELGAAEPDDDDMAGAQADRENEMMVRNVMSPQQRMAKEVEEDPTQEQPAEQGPVAVPVKQWHNHAVHLERHYRFMMDEEFERLAVAHPDIDRLFDEHVTVHQQAIAAQQQQQMEAMMAMRGMPDGPSGKPGVSKPSPQEAIPS